MNDKTSCDKKRKKQIAYLLMIFGLLLLVLPQVIDKVFNDFILGMMAGIASAIMLIGVYILATTFRSDEKNN